MNNTGRRESLINIALATGSVACVLLLFLAGDWLYSRTQTRDPFAQKPLANNGIKLYSRDTITGWYELNSRYLGEDRYGKLTFAVRTDQHGFRKNHAATTEYANLNKPTLVLLGDSFTYGVGLNWDGTFAAQLAKIYGGQVINAGVNSHSPTPHLYRLKRWFKQGLIPDRSILIMAVDISDVFDEATRWNDGPSTPVERTAAHNKGAKTEQSQARATFFNPITFQLTHQIYYGAEALVKHFIDDLQVRNNIRSAFTHRPWSELETAYQPLGVSGGLARLTSKIKSAATLSHSQGHHFYLLIYPWPAQLAYNNTFSWQQAAIQACHKPTCSGVINTFPLFRQIAARRAQWQKELYIAGDMHFNATGNRLIAEQIMTALQQ